MIRLAQWPADDAALEIINLEKKNQKILEEKRNGNQAAISVANQWWFHERAQDIRVERIYTRLQY